ncbi:cytochrome c oxidase assembly factor CtaG [Bacillus freudenreichii]|nr:cytochrome c oxidase assembly factor CtaG [Bacillus freudenreichii]
MDFFGGMVTWNMPLLMVLACISVIYCFFIKKDLKIKPIQPWLFFMCIGLFYLLMGSPLYVLSHASFSTHMIQMSILYFVIPPLFLLGIPVGVIQKVKTSNILKKLSFSPFIALIVFSILFFLYHLPPVLPFLFSQSAIHTGFNLILLVLSFLMWLPITAFDTGSENKKKRYSWWSGILLMPACLLFIVNGLISEVNASPLLNQLILELCIPAGQVDSLLPFQMNKKLDQVLGGLLMLGLHKVSLMMTFRLSSLKTNEENVKFEIIKPSLRRME